MAFDSRDVNSQGTYSADLDSEVAFGLWQRILVVWINFGKGSSFLTEGPISARRSIRIHPGRRTESAVAQGRRVDCTLHEVR